MLDPEIDDAVTGLAAQWAVAERRIKQAEFVVGNRVVTAAISELRYAGRKLIDANQLIVGGQWRNDPKEKARLLAFLADATEDCVKSKHDAIDSMMFFVSDWFGRTEEKAGLAELQKYFPDYIQLTGMISGIQDKIADSRGDRIGSRDGIYDAIEIDDYTKIIDLYRRMREAEPRVQALAARERVRGHILLWGTILGVALGIAALAVGIPALWYAVHPP